MSGSCELWFAAESVLSDCADIEATIRTRSRGVLPWIKPFCVQPRETSFGRGSVRRPVFTARGVLKRSLDDGFAIQAHTTRTTSSHREPLSLVAERQSSVGLPR